MIHLKLVWQPNDPEIYEKYVDNMSQCLKGILDCLDTFLDCSLCRTKSHYIIALMPMCEEILANFRKLFSTQNTSSIFMREHEGVKKRHGRSGSQENSNGRWKLSEDEEMHAVRYLLDLRAVRLGRSIQQLENLALANRLPCYLAIRHLRSDFMEVLKTNHTRP